jgi:hypothetical protein
MKYQNVVNLFNSTLILYIYISIKAVIYYSTLIKLLMQIIFSSAATGDGKKGTSDRCKF